MSTKDKIDFINMIEGILMDETDEINIFKLQYILCVIKRIRKTLGKYFSQPENN